MSNWKRFLGVLVLPLAFACGGDRAFEEFYSFEGHTWSEKDTAVFDLNDVETAGQKLIAIRYSEEYPFSNCYVRVVSSDSLGAVLDNTLINVPLFDSKSGKPMGKGFGNSFTRYDTLPMEFPSATSQVKLIQYMRQEHLAGLDAIGIKILKKR